MSIRISLPYIMHDTVELFQDYYYAAEELCGNAVFDEELTNFLNDKIWDYAHINVKAGLDRYADYYIDGLLSEGGLNSHDYTCGTRYGQYYGYVTVYVDESVLYTVTEDLAKYDLEELLEFSKECFAFDLFNVDDNELKSLYMSTVSDEDDKEEIDMAIDSEIAENSIFDLSEDAIGLVLCFIAFQRQTVTSDVVDFFTEELTMWAEDAWNGNGGWRNFIDERPFVEALNKKFKFEPELYGLWDLEDYVKDKATGTYIVPSNFDDSMSSNIQTESFKIVATKLKKLLESV